MPGVPVEDQKTNHGAMVPTKEQALFLLFSGLMNRKHMLCVTASIPIALNFVTELINLFSTIIKPFYKTSSKATRLIPKRCIFAQFF